MDAAGGLLDLGAAVAPHHRREERLGAPGLVALQEVERAVKRGKSAADVAGLSGVFYSIIPHAFGMARPPPLNTSELIREKFEMLAQNQAFCGCGGLSEATNSGAKIWMHNNFLVERSGKMSKSSGEFLLQEDYPFLCGQYWPPELDFFEHFSPEHTWFWRPNSQSVHSPNQYVGLGRNHTPQGGYCPTTLAGPGEAWCFGVSGAGSFPSDPTERYINYAMKWDPDGVDYYMDDVFMHRFTTDQVRRASDQVGCASDQVGRASGQVGRAPDEVGRASD